MKNETFKEKLSNFVSKMGRKNLVVIASVALIAVALIVGITVFNQQEDDGFDYSQGAGMQDVNSESEKNNESDSVDTYFSSVELDRKRTRDEALEVLQGVVDNASASEEAKSEALAEITTIAKIMETEANIETLVKAKGFEECIAVISDGAVSVIVKAETLQANEAAQIFSIAYETTGIAPENISIINK